MIPRPRSGPPVALADDGRALPLELGQQCVEYGHVVVDLGHDGVPEHVMDALGRLAQLEVRVESEHVNQLAPERVHSLDSVIETDEHAIGPRNEELDRVGQDAVVELRHRDEMSREDIEVVAHERRSSQRERSCRWESPPPLAGGTEVLPIVHRISFVSELDGFRTRAATLVAASSSSDGSTCW